MRIVEEVDRWTLSFSDALVTALQIDYRLSLRVAQLKDSVLVVIETPLSIRSFKVVEVLDPGHAEQMAPALRLLNMRVDNIVAGKDGILHMLFGDGTELNVTPSDAFESWQILSSDFMLVCQPGGVVGFSWNKSNQ